MNFQDLLDTVERLKNDPRVHPNTKVEITHEQETIYCEDGIITDRIYEHPTDPLCSITVNGSITLSTHRAEPAVAR